jgi:hypothetical protein
MALGRACLGLGVDTVTSIVPGTLCMVQTSWVQIPVLSLVSAAPLPFGRSLGPLVCLDLYAIAGEEENQGAVLLLGHLF